MCTWLPSNMSTLGVAKLWGFKCTANIPNWTNGYKERTQEKRKEKGNIFLLPNDNIRARADAE